MAVNTPDMREQQWLAVILSPISVSGAIITVSDTFGLHPKAKITLISNSGQAQDFEIKRVLNDTQIVIGNIGTGIVGPFVSPVAFSGGTLQMGEENRNKFGSELVLRAVYQEEPALALRTMLVNKYGAAIDGDNPVPVTFDGSISIGTVEIKGSPSGVLLNVNSDGSINTSTNAATTPAIFNVSVPAANTEVSQALPANTKSFCIKVRGSGAQLQFAFIATQSATNFISVPRGANYDITDLLVPALTIYFQTDKASQVVEIVSWS